MMLPILRAGEHDRKLAILNPSEVTDGYGTVTQTYAIVGYVWAKIRSLNADEQLIAEGMQAVTTHEITVEYRSIINMRSRLQHGDRVFEITSIQDVNDAHVALVLTCRELRD